MTQPLLSICIPTYNRANYLHNCLDSLRIQLRGNDILLDSVEIVISDNCSTDNTSQIAEGFRKYFKNFTYTVNKKDVGFDLNVVNVVKNSTGKYCWYLGDDDVIINGSLLYVYNRLKDFKYDVVTVEVEPIVTGDEYKKLRNYSDNSTVEIDNFNDFYFKGYCQGGFSVLIFNRERWLSCLDINNFLKHWLYYETVLKMLVHARKKMLYINQPIISTGQDCRWAENGTELYTYVNALILMEKMINFGFDKEKIIDDLNMYSKRIIIMLLRAKGHGLKCDRENLRFMLSNLKRTSFWRLSLATVIYFIPNIIIVSIRDFKKLFKKVN